MSSRFLPRMVAVALFFLCASLGHSQVQEQTEQLRIQIWADLDAFPGLFGDEEKAPEEQYRRPEIASEFQMLYGFSIDRARQIAPFLMGGMIWGWNFEYTPYDKTRGVDEYFEYTEFHNLDRNVNPLEFVDPEIRDERLMVRVWCNRTREQQAEFDRWMSIVHPHIKGVGEAPVHEGFEGIKEAVGNSIKNAVREYWRGYLRNKPKEISGTVLLIRDPRIYIKNGRYVVDLDFFMETDRIIEYTQF